MRIGRRATRARAFENPRTRAEQFFIRRKTSLSRNARKRSVNAVSIARGVARRHVSRGARTCRNA
jgi:hypothetical protein